MSFAQLKKKSGSFAEISKKLNEEKRGSYDDDRFWKLEVDKSGNGYAVIRFLPEAEGEEYPFVRLYTHSFQSKETGKWYIENSLTTLGQVDPVTEHFFEVRGDGRDEVKKEAARPFSRRTRYITNILVVEDEKNPQNEGKVFMFEFGPKIFEKIERAMNPPPEFKDEKPFNPFDFWTGANFKLKAITVSKQRSYEPSGFAAQTPLLNGDDAALEAIWKQQHKLQDEIAPGKFKSYDELKRKFVQVLGGAASTSDASTQANEIERATAPAREPVSTPAPSAPSSDDDALSEFQSLLKDFD